jgi:hypothetical protein
MKALIEQLKCTKEIRILAQADCKITAQELEVLKLSLNNVTIKSKDRHYLIQL